MNILGFSFRKGYFQTWGAASRIGRWPLIGKHLLAAIRWLCGKTTGHVVSKTEWGYGGGPNADVWCRWCNELGAMPLADAGKRYENMRQTIWAATGCDIAQGEWQPPAQTDQPPITPPQEEQAK